MTWTLLASFDTLNLNPPFSTIRCCSTSDCETHIRDPKPTKIQDATSKRIFIFTLPNCHSPTRLLLPIFTIDEVESSQARIGVTSQERLLTTASSPHILSSACSISFTRSVTSSMPTDSLIRQI